ncbi:MAG: LysR family transcriptional regulator [Acidimicrobiales bacterium]|nr:LysR family transcriptional regulator [Hyphomonadaceae bacterium]RZV42541.1 MAG: LysR family transcriptional regulator [Acidimicrobiales bacterium]
METWQFNIRHLRAFLKTVDLGTLISASQAVNLSQSAVTQAIAKLENQLGVRLFIRQNEGMEPTEAARIIYPRVQDILGHIGRRNTTHTQIKAFLALAQGGNYAEASQLTGLSTASLHRAVRDLEILLRQKLTRRKGRGIILTDFGQNQARHFGLAAAELRYMLDDLSALTGKKAGRIAIGAMPLCRARVLPSAIVAYMQKFPTVDINIAEGSFVELIDPLRNGELDFLIGALRDPGPGPDLVQIPLFDDAPVIVARAGHPLMTESRRRSTPLQALAEFPWCVPNSGVPLRENWESLFTDAGLSVPRISVECGSVIANRQILMKTDCLTILSPDQVAVELEAGWLGIICPLPPRLNRVIGLTHREGWRPTNSQSLFMNELRAVC